MIYAILFILSIGLACSFYLHQSYQRSYTHSALHAKVQLHLYARSLKNMLKLCLQTYDFNTCQMQTFSFPNDYHFRAALTELNSQVILLDIHGHILHPTNNNTFRITKRYVLLNPPKHSP
ncbi:hypothetical protein CQA63_03520 [Helicobacter marmotae]|uniref:Uncharacterized protein n=2 Tax=Helicobacter marmotae TaxID=152490 RepID=A0A3D8I5V7_9HELI|nr:hypothetical protein CQA63_03520 [Helicobacter marmotae]